MFCNLCTTTKRNARVKKHVMKEGDLMREEAWDEDCQRVVKATY